VGRPTIPDFPHVIRLHLVGIPDLLQVATFTNAARAYKAPVGHLEVLRSAPRMIDQKRYPRLNSAPCPKEVDDGIVHCASRCDTSSPLSCGPAAWKVQAPVG
jgi:hypothetical protein